MTQVQWIAKRTMNIMKIRITIEPMLELAKSLVWLAGSTVGVALLELLDFDCINNTKRLYLNERGEWQGQRSIAVLDQPYQREL